VSPCLAAAACISASVGGICAFIWHLPLSFMVRTSTTPPLFPRTVPLATLGRALTGPSFNFRDLPS
jgi:hypothetical protein